MKATPHTCESSPSRPTLDRPRSIAIAIAFHEGFRRMGRHERFPGLVKSAANILAPVHSPRPRRWSSANTSQSSRSPGQANTTSLNRRNAPRPSSARSSRSRRRWSGRVAVKSTMSSYARRDPVGHTCSHLSAASSPSSSSKESSNTNSGHSSPFVRSSRPPALSGPPSIRSASCSRSTASCSSGVASAERSRDSQRGTSVTVVPNPPHLLRRIQTDRASLPRLSRSADRRVRHPVAPGLAGFIRTDTGRAVQIKAEVSRSSHALQRVHVLEHRHRARLRSLHPTAPMWLAVVARTTRGPAPRRPVLAGFAR